MNKTRTSVAALLLAVVLVASQAGASASSTLTVVRAGSGTGTVTSNAGAINCGGTCSDTYADGTPLTLSAVPAVGNQFTGWLGPCTGTGSCQFTINGATTATATFAPTALGAPSLDVDGSSSLDPLTDGLLVLRYLFGLSGQSLIDGAVTPNATRSTAEKISGYLTDIRPALDIDGNGRADALTDGLLIIRYLLGLRGDALIVGAVGSDALRITFTDIEGVLAGVNTPSAALPPDPAAVAPPIDPTTPNNVLASTSFLYLGTAPIQTGVAPGTIVVQRAAVLRGMVRTRDGNALPGVKVTVRGHPEFGQTLSRADGAFDLAVNGGGLAVVNYEKAGFLPAQRQVNAPWQDFAFLPDVVLIPLDTLVTPVNLSTPAMQSAQGSAVTDTDGTRRATLLVPQGTTANLVLANGSIQPVGTLNIRATEYTVGANGPNAMPASLPPTSGYTYAVELSADEAIAAGATSVAFSQPLPVYVENFLSVPVGMAVPAGFYDRAAAAWVAISDGRVIKITSINGGVAAIDSVGTGSKPALSLSNAELQKLATLYAVGQELWRVPVAHFTPLDLNYPVGAPPDGIAPQVRDPVVDDRIDNTSCAAGSILECENQTLGESLGVAGTPFTLNYRSTRVPGWTAGRHVDIDLSGPSLPASLRRIDLEVQVAGRSFHQSFAPLPNQLTQFTWDGLDAYGRPLQGTVSATIKIGYVYDGFMKVPGLSGASFGAYGSSAFASVRTGTEVTLSARYRKSFERLDARAFGLGGWTLGAHHFYDPLTRVLHLGTGGRRSANSVGNAVNVVAGVGFPGFAGDGGQATAAKVSFVSSLVMNPDGSFLFVDLFNRRIRRVGTDGIITTVAGNGSSSTNGDGGQATSAGLSSPIGVATAPDGSFHIVSRSVFAPVVRRVGTNGIISTVAGTTQGFSGDGGPATLAKLNAPVAMVVGPDGSLYIADRGNLRIRRVGPDGIITTVAGTGSAGYNGDGIPATQANLDDMEGIALGPDGSLYISDLTRIRRVGPDGIIATVAGNGSGGTSGDGGPATQAQIVANGGITVGTDGSVYFSQDISSNGRVRRVGPDGIITTVAGRNGVGDFSGLGLPATQTELQSPRAMALDPAGNLYIAETYWVRRTGPPLPGFSSADFAIPSEDGRHLYQFNAAGHHLRTIDSRTGGIYYEFAYDAAGRLAGVTEKTGGTDNVTTIEHDANGKPTRIVGPYGRETQLATDGNGFLSAITNPAGEVVQIGYSAAGLLTSFTNPRGKTSNYAFDARGVLLSASDPTNATQTLARTDGTNQFQVTRTTALSRTTAYKVEDLPGKIRSRTITAPDGTQDASLDSMDAGTTTATASDGAVTNSMVGPDPRFGMQSPVVTSSSTVLPGGPTRDATTTRTAVLTNPLDPLSITSLGATSTVAGNTTAFTYTASTRTEGITSAAGRTGSTKLDAFARPVQVQIAGLAQAARTYDSRGRIASLTWGAGAGSRTFTFAYNAQGLVASITDPLSRTAQFAYDAAGRLTGKTLPDGRVVALGYDAAGNIVSVTPPARPAHAFGYSDRNELTLVTPPAVPGTGAGTFTFNPDRQLLLATRADNRSIAIGYDSGGRATSRTFATGGLATGTDTTSYDSSGRVAGRIAAGGVTTSYTYSGPLRTDETWSGLVAGSVSATWDTSFRVASQSVNGADPIAFSYDSDNLLIGAGDLALTLDPQHGLTTGTTLGAVGTTAGHNTFGEVTSYSASANASPVYDAVLVRDALGRIIQKTETIGGATDVYAYTYDIAGRLTGVTKNGAPAESYGYDDNGNRISATVGGVPAAAVYDNQDRLTSYGTATYAYTAAGELLSRTAGVQVTNYQYDQAGNLLGVTLPGGTAITYVVDARDRRVGRRVNAATVQRLLYGDRRRPVAELDGAGALVSRFVYAGSGNVPAYMIKAGVAYRLVTDHLGSVRLVVNAATGAIAQRIDYDTFGNVTADSSQGFQPFGFAGGIYDPDTGLVRFGARDYDPKPGRWTAKDPIGFRGGDTNLYGYVKNDPLNRKDASGLAPGTCAAGGPQGTDGTADDADLDTGQSPVPRLATPALPPGVDFVETYTTHTVEPEVVFGDLWADLAALIGGPLTPPPTNLGTAGPRG